MKEILYFLLFFIQFSLLAQEIDSLDVFDLEEVIESRLENEEKEGDFQENDIFNDLLKYTKRKIPLNPSGFQLLKDLELIDEFQLQALLDYRKKIGKFLAIYEIQAVPKIDMATIKRIRPFITLNRKLEIGGVLDGLKDGEKELYVRWVSQLGNIENSDSFEGNLNNYYIKFKSNYYQKVKFGLVAEKDIGESFFQGSNKYGFDYYSAHFLVNDLTPWLKTVALGDYKVSFGQGLLIYQGFSQGKGLVLSGLRKVGRKIQVHSGIAENDFMRGVSFTLNPIRNLEMTGFYSNMQKDGNIIAVDTLDFDEDTRFSSFSNSGYHRTSKEILGENSVNQISFGANTNFYFKNGHIGANWVSHRLDKPFDLNKKVYNKFYFSGKKLDALSTDFAFSYHNLSLFGEVATEGNNRKVATIIGSQIGLGKNMGLAMIFRHFPIKYHSIYADPIGETAQPSNETGLYLGLEMNPSYSWRFSGYLDVWKNKWPKFSVSLPSDGVESSIKINYKKKRKYSAYFKMKFESKGKDVRDVISYRKEFKSSDLLKLRLNFKRTINGNIELRNRFEYVIYDDKVNPISFGYLAFQDLIWRVPVLDVKVQTRLAYFDTPKWDTRIYAFESNIRSFYYLPAYYGRGTRFYVKMSYKGISRTTIELKYGIWSYLTDLSLLNQKKPSPKQQIQIQVITKL